MNFLKNLFRINSKKNKIDTQFDEYKQKLDALNLTTVKDLENLLQPLIREAFEIIVEKPSRSPEKSQGLSHFGGDPFFNQNEEWPLSKKRKPLQFIFQIYACKDYNLPNDIELIQFFYDWNEFPWDTNQDGWLIKYYKQSDLENIKHIIKPYELEKSKYCKISVKKISSLPDWDSLERYCNKASMLSCVLDHEEPWELYNEIVTKLVGEPSHNSQLKGYPLWIQGEATPENLKNEPTQLLFQLDSEENANLMWGDSGSVYIFYDENSKKTGFTLQCY